VQPGPKHLVASRAQTFEFAAFVDLLNALGAFLVEPCKLEIDLSAPHFFGPTGMVPLIALVDDLCRKGWNIDVVPPGARLGSYWKKAGWIAAIEGSTPPEPESMTTFTPLASYTSFKELNQCTSSIIDVLSKVAEFNKGVLGAVEWCLNEIADNVLVHAGGAKGWIQLIARPAVHNVDLVVVDRGAGILHTLQEGYPDIRTDEEALRLAIAQGVTRNKAVGQGNGLAGSLRIAQVAHGYVNIVSGSGNLRLFDDGRIMDVSLHPYEGTIVTITLPTGSPIELGQALWGHPVNAFEYSHVTQEGIYFSLEQEASGYGNRGSGEELALKLRNIMNQFPDESVILDFAGVDTPSASFLDEFLAKTIKREGVTSFFSRFQFRNMSPFVRQTADAVIEQRLGS
jgi:anti-sigma regulatory factor (Ser/Thr protein kinase)